MTREGNGTPPHGVSDAEISAWLDGSLDQDGMARMDRLAQDEPGIVLRAERMRHLDDLVRTAVPLEDDVPQALLERLGLAAPAAPASAQVIDLAAARSRRAAGTPAPRARGLAGGFGRMAAGFALVAGLGLGIAVWFGAGGNPADRPARADYTALGDAARPGQAAAPANAIVMFSAGLPAAQARAILHGSGAQIVAGPSAAGAWQLALAPGRRDAALAALRRRADVRLAEPLDGAGR